MTHKQQKVLLFGAGKAGQDALSGLNKHPHFHILAFVDNDPLKIGKKLEGIPIIRPQDMNGANFDLVMITSSFKDEIHKQLVELGVPENRIQSFPTHPWAEIDTSFSAFRASLSDKDGAFDQFLFDWSVRTQHNNPSFKHIFVASFPKSGSTFLFRTLLSLLSFERTALIYRGKNIEQEVYLPALMEVAQSDTITRQHPKATEATLELLNTFSI